MRYFRDLMMVAALLALGACATATVVPVGNARAPIDPSQVRIYAQAPAHYEVLGILSGNSNFEGTSQGGVSDVIKKLKEQAAKLGANGVLLGKMGEQYLGSTGGSSYLGWGTFIGSSNAAYSKTMQAQAIYVGADAPQQTAANAQPYSTGAAVAAGWPLPMPQFDTYNSCKSSGSDVPMCQSAEHNAELWLSTHGASVQTAGYCTSVAQSTQSYTMLKSCVLQQQSATQQ